MKNNFQLMDDAKASLEGRWGLAIGGFFIYTLLLVIAQNIPFIGTIVGLIISGPMFLGSIYFSLKLARGQETNIEIIFDGFKEFGRALGTYLLMSLYIFLWTLLLIIPGIIKSISYSQTFYILAEDDTISSEDAILKSMEMMEGYKWKYFLLGLNFIGWSLLCILTLGIGFLWLIPYIRVSITNFYLDLKGDDGKEDSNEFILDALQPE